MEKARGAEQGKVQQQQSEAKQQTPNNKGVVSGFCKNCGTQNHSGARFCEECGNNMSISPCRNCGKEVLPSADICEHCGTFVDKTECTFCGGMIEPGDKFCCDCGSPTEGISCSKCGTLSFSDFCQGCNSPLTERAAEEIKALAKDPQYQEVLLLYKELQQFEEEAKAEIAEKSLATETDAPQQKEVEITDPEILAYRQKIAEALNDARIENKQEPPPKTENKPKPNIPPPAKPSFSDAMMESLKKNKQKEIENRRKELQEKIEKMGKKQFPSPQISRNFHAARKIPGSNMVWECFFTGDVHPNPQNCGKPQLGGKWIIEYGEIHWQTHDGSR